MSPLVRPRQAPGDQEDRGQEEDEGREEVLRGEDPEELDREGFEDGPIVGDAPEEVVRGVFAGRDVGEGEPVHGAKIDGGPEQDQAGDEPDRPGRGPRSGPGRSLRNLGRQHGRRRRRRGRGRALAPSPAHRGAFFSLRRVRTLSTMICTASRQVEFER